MTEARWLDQEEQRIWRWYLLHVRMLFETFEREMQAQGGIPLAYYEILVQLSESPGRRLRMSDLAASSQASRSRLSHAVARLEEAGWVRREHCAADRRGTWAVLTDEGMEALREMAPVHVEGVRTHLFDQLSREQVAELGRIGEAVVRHLRTVPEVVANCPTSALEASLEPATSGFPEAPPS